MTAARVRIADLIDRDPASARYCGHSIGRVLEIPQPDGIRYVRVDRIERSGELVYGIGVCVSSSAAVKIQTKWDIRWGLRVAPNPPAVRPDKPPASGGRIPPMTDVDSAAAAIVAAGYRELAKRCHPDAGGSHDKMSLLTQAHRQLKQILEIAK